jgi:hypothetical protein
MTEILETSQSVNGTSFFEDTLYASVNLLKRLIGEPTYSEPSADKKTRYEWQREINGNAFTIYDYKFDEFGDDDYILWHIGGKSKEITKIAQRALYNKMIQTMLK